MPRSLLATVAAAAVVALVVVAALALAGALNEDGASPPPGAAAQAGAGTARVVDRVRASLVYVNAPRGSGGRWGSGFLLDRDGHVLTNSDVVAGARAVAVEAEGADGPIRAERLGTDSATGIAVLKISRGDAQAIEPVSAGDDDSVQIGEPVIAIGAPFGLDGAVTAGVVSALHRTIVTAGGMTVDGAIETDALVGEGNSGGPLVDGSGHVIGVAVAAHALAAGGGGRGFAVPIGTAEQVAKTIESQGSVRVPALGVGTVPLSPGLAQLLGLSVEHGLLVRVVTPGGPAERAGVRPARPGHASGDVIVAIDRQGVREPRDVAAAVARRKPGQSVELELVRHGRRLVLHLRLGAPAAVR